MTDEKPKQPPLSNDMFIADTMLRITALEKLLIQKGVFTVEELITVTEETAKNIAKVVLEKLQASKDLEAFIADLTADNKDKKEFNN
jgi:hypothetical protein